MWSLNSHTHHDYRSTAPLESHPFACLHAERWVGQGHIISHTEPTCPTKPGRTRLCGSNAKPSEPCWLHLQLAAATPAPLPVTHPMGTRTVMRHNITICMRKHLIALQEGRPRTRHLGPPRRLCRVWGDVRAMRRARVERGDRAAYQERPFCVGV